MKNIFQGLDRGGLVHEKHTTYFTYESCKIIFYVHKTLFQKDFFTVKTLSSRQPYSILTDILLTVYIVCKS